MFTVDERDRLREWLIDRAGTDEAVAGAAFTGSLATGDGDRWSDTDLVLAVRGDVGETAARWTRWLGDEFGTQHHWDLASGGAIVRVFLLRDWLELDLTFAPEAEFGPRGAQWRTVFGQPQELEPWAGPDREVLAGLIWHHALHAWICLRRERRWQAEHWISAIRDHVITLACLRLSLPAANAKGAHLLPDEITGPLREGLVRELTELELHRALAATTKIAATELGLSGLFVPDFSLMVSA